MPAQVRLCEVLDDAHGAMLAALLLELQPAEVLHERHGLSPATERLLRAMHGPAATAQDPARRGRPAMPDAHGAWRRLSAAAGWGDDVDAAPPIVRHAAEHAHLALRAHVRPSKERGPLDSRWETAKPAGLC